MERALVVIALLALVALGTALARRAAARRTLPARLDPADVGEGDGDGVAVVAFTSPYCLPCQQWKAVLAERAVALEEIDVARRPELARRYGISATPVVLAVRARDGAVLTGYEDAPTPAAVDRLVALAGGAPQPVAV